MRRRLIARREDGCPAGPRDAGRAAAHIFARGRERIAGGRGRLAAGWLSARACLACVIWLGPWAGEAGRVLEKEERDQVLDTLACAAHGFVPTDLLQVPGCLVEWSL